MMCRLLHSIPRGLRHKAQANINQAPRPGGSSQSNKQSEDNLQRGRGLASLGNDPKVPDTRSTSDRQKQSLVKRSHWKWHSGQHNLLGKSQWESYGDGQQGHTAHEALTWGATLALSLHLSRVLTAASLLPGDSSGGEGRGVVPARPPGRWGGVKSALSLLGQQERPPPEPPESAKPKRKATSEATGHTSLLATAAAELRAVETQALGQAHDSRGVSLAKEGDLQGAAGHFLAGSRAGFVRATFNLAVCYEQGRGVEPDQEKAAGLYQQASRQGHPKACYNLGVFHLTGVGGVQQDMALGLQLIQRAAAAGVKQANLHLGVHFLENDEGRDEEKAVDFLQKAVDDQDMDAQFHLGLCHEHGWGLPANSAKAASLYRRSAEKAHPGALYSLARFHQFGLGGLPVDKDTALALYRRASQAGHGQAEASLQELENTVARCEAGQGDVLDREAGARVGACDLTAREKSSLRQSTSAPDLTRFHLRGALSSAMPGGAARRRLNSKTNWLSTSDLTTHQLWPDWAALAGQQPGPDLRDAAAARDDAAVKECGEASTRCSLGGGGDERHSLWLAVS